MCQLFMNPTIVSMTGGITPLSPLYFNRYTSSPNCDRTVSNSGCPNSLYPIMVLEIVCTSRTYPRSHDPLISLGLISIIVVPPNLSDGLIFQGYGEWPTRARVGHSAERRIHAIITATAVTECS